MKGEKNFLFKTGKYLKCSICGIEKYYKLSRILRGKAKTCSLKCKGIASRGMSGPYKGRPNPSKGIKRPHCSGKNHPCWKENGTSYNQIHHWLRKNISKSIKCSKCGKNPGTDKLGRTKLQWSNISGKYKRDISDWQVLCAQCHVLFDKPWLKDKRNCKGQFS